MPIGETPEGKLIGKRIGPRKKDAEAFLAQIHTQKLDGSYRDITKITFPEFAELWINTYAKVQVKPSTLLNYESMLSSSLLPFFGSVPLTAIRTQDVQRYVAKRLEDGKSPATVQKALVLLKGMFKQAVEWGYLKINPASLVKPPRKVHVEMQWLLPNEIPLLLEALPEEWRPLFFTAIFTGMRLGELLALQWGDIDWNSSTIRVRRTVWNGQFQEPKTKNSIRSIGMSPRLYEVLKKHRESAISNQHDLVFTSNKGQIIDGSNLRKRVFDPALERAGLRKIRIHDLRHTFASLLINQGENLKYVQSLLGHASITQTVDRYGHLMPDIHVGAGVRLDRTVFGNE